MRTRTTARSGAEDLLFMSDRRKTLVYVLALDGSPLMPCEPVIVRLLLKQGNAKVKRRESFTIKLLYESAHYIRPLTLGVDTGSSTFGTAVARDNGSVVYVSEVTVRNDVHERMERQKAYRRTDAAPQTAVREPAEQQTQGPFLTDHGEQTAFHEKEIAFMYSILPVTRIAIQGGAFDPHRLKNPALHSPKMRP